MYSSQVSKFTEVPVRFPIILHVMKVLNFWYKSEFYYKEARIVNSTSIKFETFMTNEKENYLSSKFFSFQFYVLTLCVTYLNEFI